MGDRCAGPTGPTRGEVAWRTKSSPGEELLWTIVILGLAMMLIRHFVAAKCRHEPTVDGKKRTMANIAVWSQRVAGGKTARARAGMQLNWRRLLALGLNVLAWVAIVEILIHVFRGH
jgi:hypothetical protein